MGTAAVEAQTVSLDDAQSKALSFMKKQNKAKVIQGGVPEKLSLAYTSQAGDETYYYVFNSNKGGYVIIGGDEVAHDVLAYSENGSFDYSRIPDNMKWFLSCYDHSISSAIKQVKAGLISTSDVVKAKKRSGSRVNIDYLLKTTWDQVAPYNSQIPLYAAGFTGNDALATGCVATATAQVMKYYEWPQKGTGNKTLSKTINGYTFSADFANTTYDWASMTDSYDYDKYTGSQTDKAVGTLMYHVGVAADMNYGQIRSGGSGASLQVMAKGLVDYFKYSKGLTYRTRDYYADDTWEDMVYDELEQGRPVLYGGAQGASGHAFVCDGYKDGKFHINWGWGGSCDNYVLLTATAIEGALVAGGTGAGGADADEGYVDGQHIVIGVVPDKDGTSVGTKRVFVKGYTLASSSAAPGSSVTIPCDNTTGEGFFYNGAIVVQNYSIKPKFVNQDDASDVVLGAPVQLSNQNPNSGPNIGSVNIPLSVEPGKTYYVTFMYEDNNGEYQDVELPTSFTVPTISIAEPTGLSLSKDVVITDNGYITADHGSVNFSVKNYDSSSCMKDIYVWVFSAEDGNSKGYWTLMDQIFAAGEEKDYELTYSSITNYPGIKVGKNYTVGVVNLTDNVKLTNQYYPLYFCADKQIDYTLTSAEWGTLCLPYSADVPDGLKAYKVTGTSGTALVKEEVTKLEMNKPYLVSGTPTPAPYTFHGPATPEASNLKNGLLVGNTTEDQTYAPKASYVLQNLAAKDGLAFYEVENDDSQKVRQYGAYLSANSSTSTASFFKFIDDEATDIDFVQQKETTSPAYNLNGMRVDSNARGFVIVNGKLKYNK